MLLLRPNILSIWALPFAETTFCLLAHSLLKTQHSVFLAHSFIKTQHSTQHSVLLGYSFCWDILSVHLFFLSCTLFSFFFWAHPLLRPNILSWAHPFAETQHVTPHILSSWIIPFTKKPHICLLHLTLFYHAHILISCAIPFPDSNILSSWVFPFPLCIQIHFASVPFFSIPICFIFLGLYFLLPTHFLSFWFFSFSLQPQKINIFIALTLLHTSHSFSDFFSISFATTYTFSLLALFLSSGTLSFSNTHTFSLFGLTLLLSPTYSTFLLISPIHHFLFFSSSFRNILFSWALLFHTLYSLIFLHSLLSFSFLTPSFSLFGQFLFANSPKHSLLYFLSFGTSPSHSVFLCFSFYQDSLSHINLLGSFLLPGPLILLHSIFLALLFVNAHILFLHILSFDIFFFLTSFSSLFLGLFLFAPTHSLFLFLLLKLPHFSHWTPHFHSLFLCLFSLLSSF
ncbi:unnamed protein product [Acanthosepion pharaonis]|uniref:Uncharacterized protein n=1 Tax=Acanthosepion pharaonis TaxID=158019 RepID=A0A812DKH1_ACAPH|nr:unnamed protein product [Sepia pharaonis]